MRTIVALAFLITASMPAPAQSDDPMETQRCIWRCLANAKGARDPAYPQCVGRLCSGDPPPAGKVERKKSSARKKSAAKHRGHRSAPSSPDIVVRRVRPVYVD